MDCIRGWREPNSTSNDQGFIVAYIKSDGKCYYRQYLYNVSDYDWESEQEATITGVTDAFTNVTLFRTPDYRIGFAITTDQDEVYWLITSRNWAGLALRPEAMEVALTDYSITRSAITYNRGYEEEALEADLTDYSIVRLHGVSPEFTAAENINNGSGNWGIKIEITLDNPVYDVVDNHANFSVSADGSYYPPLAAEIKTGSDNKIIILTCTDFNAAYGNDIRIDYTLDAGTIVGEAGQDLETQYIEFTPTGLVEPTTPAPEYSSAENEYGEEL
jgi:hypothetical protein